MVLPKKLLSKAKKAQRKMQKAEESLQITRAQYHVKVGTLADKGGTIREIGEALGISYQRVHQILKTLVCNFCGASRKEIQQLIAGGGPGSYICGKCIHLAQKTILEKQSSQDGRTTIRVLEKDSSSPCTFCNGQQVKEKGRFHKQISTMAVHNDKRICNLCIDLCLEILREKTK